MGIYTPRRLIWLSALLVVVTYIRVTKQATIPPPPSDEQGNSSSGDEEEESDEDYDSEEQRRKRSADDEGNPTGSSTFPRLPIPIPGLPDPAAILKIVEVLQTVSQQVIPILVEGINKPVEIVTEHLNKDFKILKRIKNRLDLLGGIKQR